jgi:hypothetical protein
MLGCVEQHTYGQAQELQLRRSASNVHELSYLLRVSTNAAPLLNVAQAGRMPVSRLSIVRYDHDPHRLRAAFRAPERRHPLLVRGAFRGHDEHFRPAFGTAKGFMEAGGRQH